MKKTIHLFFATLLLVVGSSFMNVPAFSESKATVAESVARARVPVTIRLSLIDISNIEVQLPWLIYSVYNRQTSTYGTVVDLYNYSLEVEEGDILYFNTASLPLGVNYTVTAADVSSGFIHVKAIA